MEKISCLFFSLSFSLSSFSVRCWNQFRGFKDLSREAFVGWSSRSMVSASELNNSRDTSRLSNISGQVSSTIESLWFSPKFRESKKMLHLRSWKELTEEFEVRGGKLQLHNLPGLITVYFIYGRSTSGERKLTRFAFEPRLGRK